MAMRHFVPGAGCDGGRGYGELTAGVREGQFTGVNGKLMNVDICMKKIIVIPSS